MSNAGNRIFVVLLLLVAGYCFWMWSKSPGPRGVAVGQVAPETEGRDLDDIPFKLSDYRGKVVLLDFWGDW